MTLEEVEATLADGYSGRRDGGLLFVENVEIGSEFVVEQFASSIQVRQAVWFGCPDLGEAELGRVYRLCSAMDERFSGCKSYVDKWGVLLTTADILAECISPRVIEVVLGQIEFVSLAMLTLADVVINGGRMVTEEEIDGALQSPSLH
jgi:hypothetical protein